MNTLHDSEEILALLGLVGHWADISLFLTLMSSSSPNYVTSVSIINQRAMVDRSGMRTFPFHFVSMVVSTSIRIVQ